MQTYEWYSTLIKPWFAPPSFVFGIAWGIIYPLIAIAGILLIYYVFNKKTIPKSLFWVFIVNMIGNILFSPIQFGLQNNFLALLDILLVLFTLAYLEFKVIKYSKSIFVLLLPYLIWGTFATILQISITFLNW